MRTKQIILQRIIHQLTITWSDDTVIHINSANNMIVLASAC